MSDRMNAWGWRDQPLLSRFRLMMGWAALPCLILLGLYVHGSRESIAFGQDELAGSQYIQAMLSMRLAPLEAGRVPASVLAPWEEAEKSMGQDYGSAPLADALRASLRESAGPGALSLPPKARYAWRQLLARVTDRSKLILDPDLDSYYMMDSTCLGLPQQLDELDRMAELAAAAKRRGGASAEEALHLQIAVSSLQAAAVAGERNFGIIFGEPGGSAEKAALQPAVRAYMGALKALDPSLASVDAARKANAALWPAAMQALDRLLQARIGALKRGMFVSLALSLLALALGWLFALKVAASVLEPVKELKSELALLQAGDLRDRATACGQDEMGELRRGVEALRLRLLEVPARLSAQTLVMAATVKTLKEDHALQGMILGSQASALTQTQVTSEEIRQTSRQAAGQAQSLLEEAAKARELSRSGSEALSKSLDSLLAIRSRVELLAADVGSLEGRARRIEGIIDSVKDLADQSNLLALNAAIEAMRAGVHGQGFGLVAREIRALADQSIAATEQVRVVLGDLNDGVREAAKASREGVHDIQRGLERVQGSAETLADIQSTVGESMGQLQRIAAVVQQQDQGLSQVFLALKDQSDRMQEAEAQQLRTAEAVRQLEDVAGQVENVVGSFKL